MWRISFLFLILFSSAYSLATKYDLGNGLWKITQSRWGEYSMPSLLGTNNYIIVAGTQTWPDDDPDYWDYWFYYGTDSTDATLCEKVSQAHSVGAPVFDSRDLQCEDFNNNPFDDAVCYDKNTGGSVFLTPTGDYLAESTEPCSDNSRPNGEFFVSNSCGSYYKNIDGSLLQYSSYQGIEMLGSCVDNGYPEGWHPSYENDKGDLIGFNENNNPVYDDKFDTIVKFQDDIQAEYDTEKGYNYSNNFNSITQGLDDVEQSMRESNNKGNSILRDIAGLTKEFTDNIDDFLPTIATGVDDMLQVVGNFMALEEGFHDNLFDRLDHFDSAYNSADSIDNYVSEYLAFDTNYSDTLFDSLHSDTFDFSSMFSFSDNIDSIKNEHLNRGKKENDSVVALMENELDSALSAHDEELEKMREYVDFSIDNYDETCNSDWFVFELPDMFGGGSKNLDICYLDLRKYTKPFFMFWVGLLIVVEWRKMLMSVADFLE